MERIKWIDRDFHFDVPPGWIDNVVARLQGTEARIRDLTAGLTEEQLRFKPGGKWSIKEHIGHLVDLESLHEGRIEDFRERKKTLRAADMKNKATERANHNDSEINDLLERFASGRDEFIQHLLGLDDDTQVFVAQHPRLDIPMKPVDMASFTAEHDDHHLASIIEIVKELYSPDDHR